MQPQAASMQRRAIEELAAQLGICHTTITGNSTIGNFNVTVTQQGSISRVVPGAAVTGPGMAAGAYAYFLGGPFLYGTPYVNVHPAPVGNEAGATWTIAGVSPKIAPQVHLFQGNPVTGAEPTPASFTEADFDGYAAKPLPTPSPPFTLPDGSPQMECGDIAFLLHAPPAVGNLITGWWVDYIYNGVRVVYGWDYFTPPVPMMDAGHAVVFSVPIRLS